MSTLMEDRLAAALRARAEQVRPEDLRPVDVPVLSLEAGRTRAARRRRTAVLAGLAAAACTAAVAAPLLLTDAGSEQTPAPAGPTEPLPTSSTERPLGAAAADVDGDGVEDAATVVRRDGTLVIQVDLASGDRAEAPVRAGVPGALLTAGDVGGGPGVELVVPVSDRAYDLPLVYTWLAGEGLVAATWPDAGLEGWRPGVPVNRWTVLQDGLRTWEAESVEGDGRFPYWDWSLDDRGRLRPGPVQLGCAAPEDAPAPCPDKGDDGKGGPDVGPRGDLPALLPALEERWMTDPFRFDEEPGGRDHVELQGPLPEQGAAVAAGQRELVVTRDGVEYRAPLAAGQAPFLVPQLLAVDGDEPVFLLERFGGDTSLLEMFVLRDAELVPVETSGEVFLGSGVVDHEGEMTEQRTWVTVHGQVFTAVLLDHPSRRHRLWRWDLGPTLVPTDLGVACIDWEREDYGRCP
ncbi:MAG TPA: hypothetical protein VFV40_00755 [Nocardioides sp.]|nr:hypothetical protein [Nocardioides sp.]